MRERPEKINHRYHKAKTPEAICWLQTFGGCAILQRSYSSIVVILVKKMFEPIIYYTDNDALNYFLEEPPEKIPHRYHPLTLD